MLPLGTWLIVAVQDIVQVRQGICRVGATPSVDHVLHQVLEFFLDGLSLLLEVFVSDLSFSALVVKDGFNFVH